MEHRRPAAFARTLDAFRQATLVLNPLFILAVFATIASTSVLNKSATFDEPVLLAGGAHFLMTFDPALNAENPPLLKALYAVPTVLMGVAGSYRDPPNELRWTYDVGKGFTYASERLFTYDKHRELLFCCRIIAILCSCLLGYAIFVTARAIWDRTVAGLLLWVYCLCPNVIANGSLITLDLGCAFFMFLSTVLLFRLLTKPSVPYALGYGISMGAALLTKYTALLLFVSAFMQLLIAAFRMNTRPAERLRVALWAVGAGAVALLMVNTFYCFEGIGDSLNDASYRSAIVNGIKALPIVGSLPLPIPSGYLRGFDIVSFRNQVPVFNIVLGTLYPKGGNWWYYYPVLMGLKMPLPLLIGLCFSAWLLIARKVHVDWKAFTFFAILPVAVLTNFSFMAVRQLGLRYILPAWPFFILMLGYVVQICRSSSSLLRGAFIVLGILYAASTILVYPNFLTYFNIAAGGSPNGWKLFADSNHDWGQDLPSLAVWQREMGYPPTKVLCFGSAPAQAYGVRSIEDGGESARYLAISTTSVYFYRRDPVISRILRTCSPIERLGNTILIYDLADLNPR